jgi:hypothetical protein
MSDESILEIMHALGRIEGEMKSLSELKGDVTEIKLDVNGIKIDLSTLRREVKSLQAEGCVIGASNKRALESMDSRLSFLEGIWKKAVMVMAGVGVGTVGVKEVLAKIMEVISGS